MLNLLKNIFLGESIRQKLQGISEEEMLEIFKEENDNESTCNPSNMCYSTTMTKEQIEKARLLSEFYSNLAKSGTGVETEIGGGSWIDDPSGPNLESNMEDYRVKSSYPKVWLCNYFKVKKIEHFRIVADPNQAAQLSANGYDLISYIPNITK
jgi:hypothetical protein